jgi:hypothetical protein
MSDEVVDEIPEWEIMLIERTVFGEHLSERPWIRHQQLTPKIKINMVDPLTVEHNKGKETYVCICGDEIPKVVMQKFFFLKSAY